MPTFDVMRIPDPAMNDGLCELLKRAVEYTHGGSASFVQSVPVHEDHGRRIVWDGVVHVFNLKGQPNGAFRCYAWSYELRNGKRWFVSVLHSPEVYNPSLAVRAASGAIRARKGRDTRSSRRANAGDAQRLDRSNWLRPA